MIDPVTLSILVGREQAADDARAWDSCTPETQAVMHEAKAATMLPITFAQHLWPLTTDNPTIIRLIQAYTWLWRQE